MKVKYLCTKKGGLSDGYKTSWKGQNLTVERKSLRGAAALEQRIVPSPILPAFPLLLFLLLPPHLFSRERQFWGLDERSLSRGEGSSRSSRVPPLKQTVGALRPARS